MRPLRHIGLLVAGALLSRATPAIAGSFQVQPTLVELRGGRPEQVVITNQKSTAVRFHVKAFAWSETEAGTMRLAPTGDIVVYPSLFTVAPGAGRAIRLGATVRSGAAEKSYRVFIEELPPLRRAASRSIDIKIRTRIGIPVFVTPTSAAPRGDIEASLSGRRLRLALRNRGNVRARVSEISVGGRAADGSLLFERKTPGWYVLAGTRRRYQLELGDAECRGLAELVIAATTDRGRWTEIVDAAAGCGGR